MTRKYRSIRMLTHAHLVTLGVLIMGTAAASASADVLYDTTSMSDNNSYDSPTQNYIGNAPAGSGFWDVQAADDFELTEPASITSVTGDFLTSSGANPSQVLVELFADVGGSPHESPSAQFLTSSFETNGFSNHLGPFIGARYTVDLSAENIMLGAGNWWLAVTPVDESDNGPQYFQVRQQGLVNGNNVHVRDGGLDHGNGYGGGWGTNDWAAIDTIGGNNPGDIGMRVQGTTIPSPSAVVVLTFAAWARRRRRSD